MIGSSSSFRIAAEAVTRVIGRRHILRGVCVEAGPGDLVALVGRNGAGKTTLLQVLAGRSSPDDGRVHLQYGGREVRGLEFRARVAFLPHELFLYPDLTARENLAFFAALHGVGDAAERVATTLQRVGLARDSDRAVRAFSRGMQQRAAVGRLLVTEAPVWLLDEPSTGLDAPGRQWLWNTLKGHAEAGGAVVWSSHDPEEVARLATRVLALKSGRVVLDVEGGPDGTSRAFEAIEEAA